MLSAHGSLGDHQFGSPAYHWPLIGKTLPYWLDEESNVSERSSWFAYIRIVSYACHMLAFEYHVMVTSKPVASGISSFADLVVSCDCHMLVCAYHVMVTCKRVTSGTSPASYRLRSHLLSIPFFAGLPPAVCSSLLPSRASISFEGSVGLLISVIVSD